MKFYEFGKADIRCHDLQHEELLICYPERWVEDVKNCCRGDQET